MIEAVVEVVKHPDVCPLQDNLPNVLGLPKRSRMTKRVRATKNPQLFKSTNKNMNCSGCDRPAHESVFSVQDPLPSLDAGHHLGLESQF